MRISDWSSDVCSSDLADTRPLSRWLTTIEPMATPTEKMAVNSVATVLSAASAFLTSGGNCAARIAPIAQKKLIETMARNSRGMCIVELTICHEERKKLWSMTR